MEISKLLEKQRNFFNSNATKNLEFRLENLNKLKHLLEVHEGEILHALYEDLNKSNFEAYVTEMGIVKEELSLTIKNLPKWTKRRRVHTPITQFPSQSFIYSEPYGISLIISPWNYPLQLAMIPLIGSLAAGNCNILKLSQKSKNTTEILTKILDENFDERLIRVVNSEEVSNEELLKENYDYIFFTGSAKVGKVVMEAAAKHLTPITLELGGKSPCIVDETANITLAGKTIAWGKFLNAGQTCVAPDYILVDKKIKGRLIEEIRRHLFLFYGTNILENPEYPKIISPEHFKRLIDLLNEGKKEFGGNSNLDNQKIEPTILSEINWDSKIMEEEIFGPILPIIEYDNLNSMIEEIKLRPKSLALYLFSEDKINKEKIKNEISYGSGCINDVLMQLANPNLPFGGVGNSGMGKYHGKFSFDTFSNKKSIVEKPNFLDIPLRYPPYKDKLGLLKKIMK
ncbi:MAG: aldehyde dehydrogenase [Tissierellia bacterium]|nr:aldehyde dehydrogenase [Tissierellia bacterium]